jgi:DNA-binding response OmpR family regulator
MKILVIDDSTRWCETMEIFLSQEYKKPKIKCSTEPEKARALIKSFKPDIILIDYEMCGKNGDVIVIENKDLIEKYNIIKILITNYDVDDEVKSLFHAYIDKFEITIKLKSLIDRQMKIKELENELKILRKINN